MAKTIFNLILKHCIGQDNPVKAMDELLEFMISNRSTFVDNNKPVTPAEDRIYG